MSLPKLTYALAMAAGKDAANRNMRSERRLVWNEDDREIAAVTFNTLYAVRALDLIAAMLDKRVQNNA